MWGRFGVPVALWLTVALPAATTAQMKRERASAKGAEVRSGTYTMPDGHPVRAFGLRHPQGATASGLRASVEAALGPDQGPLRGGSTWESETGMNGMAGEASKTAGCSGREDCSNGCDWRSILAADASCSTRMC